MGSLDSNGDHFFIHAKVTEGDSGQTYCYQVIAPNSILNKHNCLKETLFITG